jgi:regulatory protein
MPKPSSRRQAESPGPLTLEDLERAALRYLDRFETSAANLKTVLFRSARRRPETDGEEALRMIDELILRYESSGLVDDRRFASSVASGLRRRGASRRAVEQKLYARRVKASAIASALEAMDRDVDGRDGEVAAARAFVRRRRLGPHRPEADREAHRLKDFSAMARAGFSLDVARIALQADAASDDVF